MTVKFYKLVDRQPVECKSVEELKAWLNDPANDESRIVGRTEFEGMVISTVFGYTCNVERNLNALGELCHFETLVFFGDEHEFDHQHPVNFPVGNGQHMQRLISPTWAYAEQIHKSVVDQLKAQWEKARDKADGEWFGVVASVLGINEDPAPDAPQ